MTISRGEFQWSVDESLFISVADARPYMSRIYEVSEEHFSSGFVNRVLILFSHLTK